MKELKTLLAMAVVMALGYLVGAFVGCSWNQCQWPEDLRNCVAMTASFVALFVGIVKYASEP